MKAMLLTKIVNLRENSRPLELIDLLKPIPIGDQILIRVRFCGVCHTELDEIEGRAAPPLLPIIPGHQVVGTVEESGPDASLFKGGERVGVAWIFSACGECEFCRQGLENLCQDFMATGMDANGGYAEYMTVSERFAYPIPRRLADNKAAPLLCAGAIGYRSLALANIEDGQSLGLTGFGASGHLVLKTAAYLYSHSKIFVFARNREVRKFALELGANWAGDIGDTPPEKLNAIVDTTPAWKPLSEALKNLKPGGKLVINAIRKEESDKDYLRNVDYQNQLWMEKEIKSVANICRNNVKDFLEIAAKAGIGPEVKEYPLERANEALAALKAGKPRGAYVLRIS